MKMMSENLRHLIRSYLQTRPRNTAEIVEHARANMDGTSIEQIEKLLKSDAQVVRVDLVRRSGVLSSGYKICEWATVDWMKNRRREE
tara:strand:- start:245 stop:505 length:261 start_codon:yes stop_codon:yes gene_type:complete